MLKKTVLSVASAAALLAAIAAPAFAASSFYLVVPVPTAAKAPVEDITVSLSGASLPKATVNQSYGESLRPYLSVTGDAAFDSAAARWSLAEGALPAGLSLDATTGAVAGTPTAKTSSPASFKVLATYKGQDGQAVYTIEVGGVVLRVRQIDASGAGLLGHTCAVTLDEGGVKCWGNNTYGQLGNGGLVNSTTPVSVYGLESGVASVSTGSSHTCAVTSSGVAKCWGRNNFGQVGGSGALIDRPLSLFGGAASVSAGLNHTCAVISGAAKCWGYNNDGQLGDGGTSNSAMPVSVVGLESGVASIEAGVNHTCAVVSGAAKCWGNNDGGQLGDGSTSPSTTPVSVVGLESDVASVSAGAAHTCAVVSGAVKCWGANPAGQLGNGSTSTTPSVTPVNVVGLESGVASVSAGNAYTCAVTSGGAAKCWGSNNTGKLGDGSTVNKATPVDVSGLGSSVASVSAGLAHTCAVMTSGAAKCWGLNGSGQLGDNSTATRWTPVDVQDSQ